MSRLRLDNSKHGLSSYSTIIPDFLQRQISTLTTQSTETMELLDDHVLQHGNIPNVTTDFEPKCAVAHPSKTVDVKKS